MIIGLCGAAGSGKNTTADVLTGVFGVAQVSFAGPIYQAVAAITGLPVEHLQDRAVKEQPIAWLGRSPRELLQTLGTEWGRDLIHREIWVRRAMQEAKQHPNVVITDVRFNNEAQAIREVGGFVWEIRRLSAGIPGGHSSEAGVSEELIDLRIDNNGSQYDLSEAVYTAWRCLLDDTIGRYPGVTPRAAHERPAPHKEDDQCQSQRFAGNSRRSPSR